MMARLTSLVFLTIRNLRTRHFNYIRIETAKRTGIIISLNILIKSGSKIVRKPSSLMKIAKSNNSAKMAMIAIILTKIQIRCLISRKLRKVMSKMDLGKLMRNRVRGTGKI